MPMPSKSATGKLDSIQCLRALAALSVLALHLYSRSLDTWKPVGGNDGPWRLVNWLWKLYSPLGTFGVDIFFIISGFIAALLVTKGRGTTETRQPLGFLGRRILRIYPVHLLAALCTVLFSIGIGAIYNPVKYLPPDQLSLYSTFKANPVTWTLVYEVRFYLVVAIAMTFGQHVRLALLAGLAIHTILTLASDFALIPRPDELFNGLALEFALGMLLGFSPRVWNRVPFPIIVGLLAYVAAHYIATSFNMHKRDYARAIGFGLPALLIVWSGLSWGARTQVPRFLSFLGDISYSTYIWHWLVLSVGMWVLKGPLGLTGELGFWVTLCAAPFIVLGVAAASYFVVERPLSRAGKRRATQPTSIDTLAVRADT